MIYRWKMLHAGGIECILYSRMAENNGAVMRHFFTNELAETNRLYHNIGKECIGEWQIILQT